MKMRFFTFLLLIAGLTINSCSNDSSPNFNFVPLRIISADLPETFILGQTYQIIVNYAKPDGCTSFSNFDVVEKDITIRNVVVFGTVRTDQEACAQAIVEERATFNFIVLHSETYLFRFWKGESANGEQEYIEVEVPVN